MHTWLGRGGGGIVDGLLDGLFNLLTAVPVSWASYELVAGREVVNSSFAQHSGRRRISEGCMHKG
jgi:hypothetical protein